MYHINRKNIFIISISVFLCALNPALKTVTLLLYIFFSFKSTYHSLMAFSFISFINLLNPNIIGYSLPIHFFIKILFVLIMFFLILIKNRSKVSELPLFKYVSYFSIIFFLINIFHPTNQYIGISILKIIYFYCTVSYLIISFSILKDINKIMSWVMSLLYFSLFTSISIYFFSYSLGTFGGSGGILLFRGVLSHPNAVGVFFLPYLSILLPLMKTKNRGLKNNYFFILIILLILFCVFVSGARGSFAGFSIGFLIVIIIAIMSRSGRNDLYYLFKQNKILFLQSIIIFLVALYSTPQFFSSFLTKSSNLDGSNLADVFLASRGSFIFISFQNFLDNPYWGLGYGIPSKLDFNRITFDPIFGVPISAPSEKAFFFSAILEEFGIIGSLIFAIFYFKMTVYIYKNIKSIYFKLLYFSVLTLSFFEFYFFSMGMFGSFNWLWIGFLSHLSFNRNKYLNN